MIAVNSIASVFLPVLYALTALLYGLAFFEETPFAKKWKSKFLIATAVVHTMYIGSYTVTNGHCLVTSPFEIMSLIAFTIIICYTVIELITRIKGTGFFLISLALIFEFFSAVTIPLQGDTSVNPVLSELGIGLHVTAAIIGYGGIAISAVYGVLYLLMYRDLKKGNFGSLYQHFPSLESLESLNTVATILGFLFLTIALGIGAIWLPTYFPTFSFLDPKLIVSFFIWVVYAVVLTAKYVFKIDGKRVITLSLSGFVLAVFSLTIVNAFLDSFHRFM